MISYLVTKSRLHDGTEMRFHVEAESIAAAAIIASESVDMSWEIIKIEVLR